MWQWPSRRLTIRPLQVVILFLVWVSSQGEGGGRVSPLCHYADVVHVDLTTFMCWPWYQSVIHARISNTNDIEILMRAADKKPDYHLEWPYTMLTTSSCCAEGLHFITFICIIHKAVPLGYNFSPFLYHSLCSHNLVTNLISWLCY